MDKAHAKDLLDRRMNFIGTYKLDERGQPIKEPDVIEWAKWFETFNPRIALDNLQERGSVSTVFIGLDYGLRFLFEAGENYRPILWETSVSGGQHHGYQRRYYSLNDAVQGHGNILEALRVGIDPRERL